MSSNKKYVVRLTDEEREGLEAMVRKGRAAACKIRHANVLLKADADGAVWTDECIAEAFGCHARTVENVRRRCVMQGLDAAIARKKQEHPSRERKLDGEGEARLITLACPEPPDVAECELSVLSRQCLGGRTPSLRELKRKLNPWAKERNKRQPGVDWRFTTDDARIKLKRLHPQVRMS